MKLNVKKLLFAGIYFCALVALWVWRAPLSVQTKLDSLIEINNADWPVDELTNKFSDIINIVVKSDNIKSAQQTANAITNILSTDNFDKISVINTDFSLPDMVNKLGVYKNSFVGTKYREILQNKEYRTITNNAVAMVTSSMTPNVLSLTEDPFLLATNYIGELKSVNGKWNLRDGFLWQYVAPNHYILISVNVDTNNTADLVNNVNLVSSVLQKYNNENVQVFMSGIPVHTANMTQTSKLELSVFSLVALIMAVLLNWLLFRKTATLIPVILSLSSGFCAGSLALFLCFAQPHILAFVFGVTLIGLGIDYSFHFINALAYKNDKNVHKNILHSFLTTFVCFLPLAFSGISLLQQISIFTITGLSAVYLGWLVFTPNKMVVQKTFITMPKPVSKKYRQWVLGIIIVAICLTLPFVKTQNNMSQLYRPNSELLNAEMLIQKLNGINSSSFLLVRGTDINDMLLNSEKIKDESENFFDLSTITPSKERQIENQNLIRALYKSESKNIQHELGLRRKPKFIETPIIQMSDIKDNKIMGKLLDRFVFDDGKYIYGVAKVDSGFKTNSVNAMIVSPAQQMTSLMEKYSYESYKLLAVCGIVLILLLFTLYGRRAFVYLAPSVLAVGTTIMVLTWFNQPITFFHLLSLFIVIGLTLDYSIFHINATDNHEIKPVLFSFLTSLIGFGILAFASFFLIHSMGITLGLGLTFGYLISLFLFRHQN